MRKSHRYLAIGALSAALVSLAAYAAQPAAWQASRAHEAPPPTANLAAGAPQRLSTAPAPAFTPGSVHALRAPEREDVGDADSFGRPLKWLGLTQANIVLSEDCSLPENENRDCQQITPGAGQTTFSFTDTAHITLPGKSANSLLCYWLSPMVSVAYWNPGMEPVIAQLRYTPTLTVESEVLLDPALIDPSTGQPFGGKLLTGMSSSEFFQMPLRANEVLLEVTRDSNVCMAGFLTRRALVETYGLTESQAKDMLRKPLTIRLNVKGSSIYVGDAALTFGLRIVGD